MLPIKQAVILHNSSQSVPHVKDIRTRKKMSELVNGVKTMYILNVGEIPLVA